MLNKIQQCMNDIDDAKEEISIMLGMANVSWDEYEAYRQNKIERPASLGKWIEDAIRHETDRIKDSVKVLSMIRKLM